MKKAIFLLALCLGTLASAQQLSRELTLALKNDDTTAVNQLINDSNKDQCLEVGRHHSSVANLAIQMNSADVLQHLITEEKIDLNNPCSNMTPLMMAAKMGQPHLVNMLLEAGADKSIALDGKTALDHAVGNQAAAIKELLN